MRLKLPTCGARDRTGIGSSVSQAGRH